MHITFGTIFTNIVFSSSIMIFITLILCSDKMIGRIAIKIYLVCILLCIFRFLVPIELFFTKTIGINGILPVIYSFLKTDISHSKIEIEDILIWGWLIGAIIKGLIIIKKHIILWKIIKDMPQINSKRVDAILYELEMEKGKINIVEIDLFPPCIVGAFKPVVILPEIKSLNDKELYYILSHEIQHYRNHDLWIKALSELLSIIYWWNPLISLIYKQINKVTEINNDLSLIRYYGSKEKLEYLQCLVKMANKNVKYNDFFALSFVKEDNSYLKQRVNVVLDYGKRVIYSKVGAFLLLLAVLSSYGIVFEPKIPLPQDVYTTEDINNGEIVNEGGRYYIILDGAKIEIENLENMK